MCANLSRVSGRGNPPLTADTGDKLPAIEFDAPQHALMRPRAFAVLHVETWENQRRHRCGQLPRDRVRRPDIQRPRVPLALELVTCRRWPAPLPPDAVAHRAITAPILLPRLCIRLGHMPRRMNTYR